MRTIQPVKRRRPGRPSFYGERTVPLRVSAKLIREVETLIRKAPRKLHLVSVGNPTKRRDRAGVMCSDWIWEPSSALAGFYEDGGLDAQALRFEADIGSRTVGVHGGVQRFAGPDCIGVCIEEPYSGPFGSVKALVPVLGAAVLTCEHAGLPWPAVHLSKLSSRDREGISAGPKPHCNPRMPAAQLCELTPPATS